MAALRTTPTPPATVSNHQPTKYFGGRLAQPTKHLSSVDWRRLGSLLLCSQAQSVLVGQAHPPAGTPPHCKPPDPPTLFQTSQAIGSAVPKDFKPLVCCRQGADERRGHLRRTGRAGPGPSVGAATAGVGPDGGGEEGDGVARGDTCAARHRAGVGCGKSPADFC